MTATPSTAAGYFGSIADEYDSLIRRAVPRYQEMTERLLDYLPAAPHIILELGCGTGNLSLDLARRFPDASMTFVDAAPEMLEITQGRLNESGYLGHREARFLEAHFEDLQLESQEFDLITSCISLHHVLEKAQFYQTLHQAVCPGGTFRFADQMRGGNEANHEINWSRWLEFCRRPDHCTEEEIRSLLDHAAEHDYYTSVIDHLKFLADAGFDSVDCVWRNGMWGIVTGDVS